jgi:uncharacterized membrane protein
LKYHEERGGKMGGKEKSIKPTNSGTKREKLLGTKKRIPAWKIIAIVLVAAALPVSWLILKEDPQAESKGISSTQVMERVNYQNQSVSMTKVDVTMQKGMVEVSLDLVKNNRLVSFEYLRPDGRIPLLAYITPAGKLVTAVSVCEPCSSTRFHIEGKQMVCNSCFTRWDLETLKGISGGCLNYPPDALAHEIQGGKLMIKEMELKNWKPRVFRG